MDARKMDENLDWSAFPNGSWRLSLTQKSFQENVLFPSVKWKRESEKRKSLEKKAILNLSGSPMASKKVWLESFLIRTAVVVPLMDFSDIELFPASMVRKLQKTPSNSDQSLNENIQKLMIFYLTSLIACVTWSHGPVRICNIQLAEIRFSHPLLLNLLKLA